MSLPPQPEKLLHQHSLATVVQHAHGYARIDWVAKPMLSVEVRILFCQLLEELRGAGLRRILTDHSIMPPLWPADCEWLTQQWAPQAAVEACCTHVAIVECAELLQRPASHLAPERLAALPICVRYFDSFTEAEQWLRAA